MATRRTTGVSKFSRPLLIPPDIRPGTPADLPFIVAMQKAHAAALGFLPRRALEEKVRNGQVLTAWAARRRAGFLHHGSIARPEVRVFQIAVTPAARGRHVGRALVDALIRTATDAGACGVSLRCLASLDANCFWRAVGFRLHAVEPGAKGPLNVWVRWLDQGRPSPHAGRFAFSSRVHPCPGCRKPTVDTWVRGARRLTLCAGCVAAAGLN